jgi:hypothetical protein
MIESLLRESISLQDVEARTRMIHEIAHHSEEVVDELITLCASGLNGKSRSLKNGSA